MARPEVTGRRVIADQLIAAFSIREFCAAHRISQSMYFKMRAMGLGPREMAVGSRRLIDSTNHPLFLKWAGRDNKSK